MTIRDRLNPKNASAGVRVTLVGSVINILLAVIKLIFGIWGHSRALVADAIHSLSDLASDIVVLGSKAASRTPNVAAGTGNKPK